MNNHRLGNRTERAWALVRNELNKLARTYSVALNWTTRAWPANNRNPLPGYDAMLTGTYRLNAALSNKPRTVANNATRHLQRDQRQRVSNNLLNRLTPPEMIAIERHGNSLTLASTVSPKITLFVDGREHREFYPNGRASQVRANFNGDRLTVVSNGDRANDFTVTFAPVNNGRRLLVTREIYAERLNRPVVVQSYYDKTAELAQWDLNNANWSYPNSRAARGDFLISDGTRVVAVLNEPLSTERTLANERFTLSV
jgi:hypothetical protein